MNEVLIGADLQISEAKKKTTWPKGNFDLTRNIVALLWVVLMVLLGVSYGLSVCIRSLLLSDSDWIWIIHLPDEWAAIGFIIGTIIAAPIVIRRGIKAVKQSFWDVFHDDSR